MSSSLEKCLLFDIYSFCVRRGVVIGQLIAYLENISMANCPFRWYVLYIFLFINIIYLVCSINTLVPSWCKEKLIFYDNIIQFWIEVSTVLSECEHAGLKKIRFVSE